MYYSLAMYYARQTFRVLVAVILLCGSRVAAAERTDFLINDDASHTAQNNPRIAVAGDGGFVIVWTDQRNGSNDIFLQRFDTDGAAIGQNRQVNDDATSAYQRDPAIGVDLSGLYSVVWTDYRNGSYPFDPDVFFQRYDSAVVPSGVNRNVTTELPDSLKETPDIALSPWGGGMLVWADYRNRNWDVYGQVISSNGGLIGTNFRVNNDVGSAQQHSPRVAVSPEGWYVVTWYDNRLGNDDIFAQRFDSLGVALGPNIRVNSDAGTIRQAFPDAATDGAGHFTVVWVDWRNGIYPANPDIYSRQFDTSLAPMTADTKINRDGSQRAQREPTISADRMGNVAIIWSDSTVSDSWDIVGQMIDVNGVVQDPNFQANEEGDSAQLQPDVALDGQYRYMTWSDKRNGDYDIYASITKYNDPSIIAEPNSLRFEMAVGDSAPDPQEVVLDHAGYNSRNFEILPSHSWLDVSPAAGSTPDTISVSITTAALPYGTYFGQLTLVDLDNNDSSMVVPVRFDVTVPILSLSADTLSFRAFTGIDREYTKFLTTSNAGGGDMPWTLTEDADWLTVSAYAGSNETELQVTVNAVGLTDGNYVEPIVVDAGDIVNSPDTVWAVVEVVANLPYILLEPDSFNVVTSTPSEHDLFTVVTNAGVGILNWMAAVNDPWLHLSRGSGLGGDSIVFTIDTTQLEYGLHSTFVDVTDSASFNVSERIPFSFRYLSTSPDTILAGTIVVKSGSTGSLPIEMSLSSDANAVYVPFEYDPEMVAMDSIVVDSTLAGLVNVVFAADSSAGVASFEISMIDADSSLPQGVSSLCDLYVTGGVVTGLMPLDKPADGLNNPWIYLVSEGMPAEVSLLPGEIRVDEQTSVDDDDPRLLPESFSLSQNYPNPFNMATTIEFRLPGTSVVRLEVFNILGQTVRLLVSEQLAAGDHLIQWDGLVRGGADAPSGVYFYRLKAGSFTCVRKMVLLK